MKKSKLMSYIYENAFQNVRNVVLVSFPAEIDSMVRDIGLKGC